MIERRCSATGGSGTARDDNRRATAHRRGREGVGRHPKRLRCEGAEPLKARWIEQMLRGGVDIRLASD